MSTCRWTGRPRSEWSASNRPIAPTIGPPAHYLCSSCPRHRQPGSPRRLAEAIAKPNQPVPARRETLAQRRMTPIFVPLWFGWALKTGHKGGHFAMFPGDCLQQPDSVAERSGFEPPKPFAKLHSNRPPSLSAALFAASAAGGETSPHRRVHHRQAPSVLIIANRCRAPTWQSFSPYAVFLDSFF